MAYDAVTVANTILRSAQKKNILDITPMKLQKLLFNTHAYYLKKYGKPLVSDPFLKWKFGPVVRDVYREFSGFGSSPITSLATDAKGDSYVVAHDDSDAREMINAVLDAFGHIDPWTLSMLSHLEGTAWSETLYDDAIIDNDTIKSSKIYRE